MNKITPYKLEYQGVLCTGVYWEDEAFMFEFKGKKYFFKQMKSYDCGNDADQHIRCVIEEFLEWLGDKQPKQTNFDKITQSVEALAEFIETISIKDISKERIVKWLQQEYNDE